MYMPSLAFSNRVCLGWDAESPLIDICKLNSFRLMLDIIAYCPGKLVLDNSFISDSFSMGIKTNHSLGIIPELFKTLKAYSLFYYINWIALWKTNLSGS